MTISWRAICVDPEANYGDIREQEQLTFRFVATTDAIPSEFRCGFWVLYSDEGNMVEGCAYPDDDDYLDNDDTAPDDDDNDAIDDDVNDGDDDNDDGACGC